MGIRVDNFAERDFAFSEARIQYDLDYWLDHGRQAEKVAKGGKYGYDYYANVRNASIWANGQLDLGSFKANLAGRIGVESFWREGLVRNGLFPGLDDNGNEYVIDDINLTTYDDNGDVVTSKGKSDISTFIVGSVKAGLEYDFTGGHRIYANAGFFLDAPKFNQPFRLSPPTPRRIARCGLLPSCTLHNRFRLPQSSRQCERLRPLLLRDSL